MSIFAINPLQPMHCMDGKAHSFTLSDHQRLGAISAATSWDGGRPQRSSGIDRYRRVESKYCGEFS
jgi:hypothetical protein